MPDDPVTDASPGSISPYLALDEVLSSLSHVLRDRLGSNFVGLYPTGSLAVGDFDLTSDVDFLVVTQGALTENEVAAVQAVHSGVLRADSRWVRHLEYSFFPIPELRRKSSPYARGGLRVEQPERDLWYFENGAATIVRSDHDNTLVTRWTLFHVSPTVLGPEPSSFAPDVTADELREEIRASMLGWEHLVLAEPDRFRNRFHQVFLVLNNCRALQDLHLGRITSKLAGVRWAMEALDARWHPLIDYCWSERQDTGIHVSQPANDDAYRATIEFMTYTARLASEHR